MEPIDLADHLSGASSFVPTQGEPVLRVAVHLIRFRNEAGLTQEELADRMDKKQSWISRVEAGQENLTMRTLGQFAYALEKDPAEFLAPVDLESAVTG